MKELTSNIEKKISEMVYNFFSYECEVEPDQLNDDTKIIEELGGDSLMFIELLELIKKEYHLNIELQAISKYLLMKPAKTLGAVVSVATLLYRHEDKIVNLL